MNKATELQEGHKWVVGYEGLYSASAEGFIYGYKYGKYLKGHKNHRGYFLVTLYKDGRCGKFSVHRLVAEAFIPNPENKPEVDHINTIRDDNRIENLKWVTRKENCNNPLSLKHTGDARRGEKHYLYGKKWSEESIRKRCEKMREHIVSEETRRKIGDAHRGRKFSEERCKQMSLARMGKHRGKDSPNAKPIKQYTKDGEFIRDWSCTAEAARVLGVNAGSIYNCLAKRFKTGGGFVWEWLQENYK